MALSVPGGRTSWRKRQLGIPGGNYKNNTELISVRERLGSGNITSHWHVVICFCVLIFIAVWMETNLKQLAHTPGPQR